MFERLVRKWQVVTHTLLFRISTPQCGEHTKISGRIKVYSRHKLVVGRRTRISHGTMLNARGRITIGDYCHLSPHVIINSSGLDIQKDFKKRTHVNRPVVLEDGVWVASGAIINAGVTLGEGCVIGAGAVVTRDIPPYTVAVGCPAKVIRSIV